MQDIFSVLIADLSRGGQLSVGGQFICNIGLFVIVGVTDRKFFAVFTPGRLVARPVGLRRIPAQRRKISSGINNGNYPDLVNLFDDQNVLCGGAPTLATC